MLLDHESPTDDFDFGDGIEEPDYTVTGCEDFDDDDWVDAVDTYDIEYDH